MDNLKKAFNAFCLGWLAWLAAHTRYDMFWSPPDIVRWVLLFSVALSALEILLRLIVAAADGAKVIMRRFA